MDTIKESGAKKASLKAMMLAGIWIAVHTVAKGVLAAFTLDYLSTQDIVLTGVCIMGVYSPITVSMWIDKFVQLKTGIPPGEGK